MAAEDLGDGLVNVIGKGDGICHFWELHWATVNTHPRGGAVCVMHVVGLDVVCRELLLLG